MTAADLILLADAHRATYEDQWLRTAFLACAVRESVWGQDPITPRSLLGWPDPTPPIVELDAQQEALWEQALRMVPKRPDEQGGEGH